MPAAASMATAAMAHVRQPSRGTHLASLRLNRQAAHAARFAGVNIRGPIALSGARRL